jgi:hypothetical protein
MFSGQVLDHNTPPEQKSATFEPILRLFFLRSFNINFRANLTNGEWFESYPQTLKNTYSSQQQTNADS